MATTLSFSPMMRRAAGFDRLDDLLERYVQGDDSTSASAFPPYNIEKRADGAYAIVMAVSGFTDKDVTITQQGDKLAVVGKVDDPDEGTEYLHRGLVIHSFERQFTLGEHIKVEGASLRHGLLCITLKHELPETAKPRIIPVTGHETAPPKAD